MTTRFDTKDPDEDITAEFDFTDLGIPSAPEIEIEVTEGVDATPESIRLGSPSIVGSKVLQRFTGGIDGVEYGLRCFANIGSDRPLIDAILPVRRRPGPAPA